MSSATLVPLCFPRMEIVILHDRMAADARPDEADALVQAAAVVAALKRLGHGVATAELGLNLEAAAELLRELQPEVVFNLVESVEGSGRLIHLAPALLDRLHVPYTGVRTEAMFLTSNKVLTKRVLRLGGVATPDWVGGMEPAKGFVPGRYIIKSVWEDASLGLEGDSIIEAQDAATLRAEIERRRSRLGGEAFAEAFVEGREFNLSLLAERKGGDIWGVRVLPPAEIRFVDYAPGRPRIVGYRAKWQEDSHEYHHTPRTFDFAASDAALLRTLTVVAERCWHLLGLSGYARVDFRVDEAGRPWVLEVNANPCLSPDAGFIAAAERAGLTMDQIVATLLEDARRQV